MLCLYTPGIVFSNNLCVFVDNIFFSIDLCSSDESTGNLMDTGVSAHNSGALSHDVHMISPEGSHLETPTYNNSISSTCGNCPTESNRSDAAADEMHLQTEAREGSNQQDETSNENAAQGNTPSEGPTTGAAAAEASGQASESSATQRNEYAAILGDMEVPEGVDPSFLAALPEHMRQEVIQDHLRMQRLSQQQSQQQQQGASQGVGVVEAAGGAGANSPAIFNEVNPEFLAALPPSIQEEVLAQQRAEQQRLAAAAAAPDAPADTTAFFLTLPAGLRQTVLQDLDDSLLPVLPPDLAQEARNLRAQAIQQRELLQERFFSHTSGGTSTALSRILRTAVSRIGGSSTGARYTIHTLPSRGTGERGGQSSWEWQTTLGGSGLMGRQRTLTRQLVDWEALACLLVLLFVDEPRLHTTRLHKVLRNLAAHEPTRRWLVQALLSMLDRSGASASPGGSQAAPFSFEQQNKVAAVPCRWLSVSLDAALGCRTAVFHLANGQVLIHPQAAHLVCRHALDALISLGKSFPQHFMPSHQAVSQNTEGQPEDFWTLIVRLEQQSQQSLLANSKGKVRILSLMNN